MIDLPASLRKRPSNLAWIEMDLLSIQEMSNGRGRGLCRPARRALAQCREVRSHAGRHFLHGMRCHEDQTRLGFPSNCPGVARCFQAGHDC